jgi:hypothetical protein
MHQEITRYDGRIDCRPSRNVKRSDVVSGASEATPRTREVIPRRSIFSSFMSTSWADVGCSSWIDDNHGDASQSSFVLDESPQLPEAPRAMVVSLSLPNRGPCVDACEVFNGNRTFRVFGLCYQSLRDAMIYVTLKSRYASCQSFEMSSCALGSSGLESCSKIQCAFTHLPNGIATIFLPIAVGGDVDHPHIDTEDADRLDLLRLGGINNHAEVEYIILQNQVGLTVNPSKTESVIGRKDDWDDGSPIDGNNRCAVKSFPAENALIIYNRTMGHELGFDGLVTFVGIADLGDSSDGELCGKFESFTNLVVGNLLNIELICRPEFECSVNDGVAGSVEQHHCPFEGIELLRSGVQLHFQGEIHNVDMSEQCMYRLRGGG